MFPVPGYVICFFVTTLRVVHIPDWHCDLGDSSLRAEFACIAIVCKPKSTFCRETHLATLPFLGSPNIRGALVGVRGWESWHGFESRVYTMYAAREETYLCAALRKEFYEHPASILNILG